MEKVMEHERKFLVKTIPSYLDKCEMMRINQGYLYALDDFEVRLRKSDDTFYFTIKNGKGMSREEPEQEISESTYYDLIDHANYDGRKILMKDRYLVPLVDGHTAELDIYLNHNSLVTVEVQFPTIEEAYAFVVPEWFGDEITDDPAFKNKNLAYTCDNSIIFTIGKCYRHTCGEEIKIVGRLDTTMFRECLIAETNESVDFKAVGEGPSYSVNWVEITEEEWMKNFS